MSKFKRRGAGAPERRSAGGCVAMWMRDGDICLQGYTRLADNPEIQTACLRIAEMISSMTIWLMENAQGGDRRITNELSAQIDIHPNRTMTRAQWMTAIVMNLLLYGNGNSVVIPHTKEGLLESLEPVSPERVAFVPVRGSYRDYRIAIDGKLRNPRDLIHIVYNPDPLYPWKGRSPRTSRTSPRTSSRRRRRKTPSWPANGSPRLSSRWTG